MARRSWSAKSTRTKSTPDYDLYRDSNLNYVTLDQVPSFGDWGLVTKALGTGAFVVTSGEVLIPTWSVGGEDETTAVVADAERTYPVELNAVVWGDGVRMGRIDLVILDEVGFNRVERLESPQAASLLYKLINVRGERSTALVTNIDFEYWGEYLGDPRLAMAFLDRIVDGATTLRINSKSYRAHRAEQASAGKRPKQ